MVGAMVAAGASTAGAQTTVHYARAHGRDAHTDPAPEPVFTLERASCRGQCAEYKLSFFEDGQVVYDGKANVSKAGRWYARVTRQTVEELVGAFRRIGYDSLQTKYPPGLTESPVAITTLREGTRIKSVEHEQGSPFPPSSLGVLEDRIDNAVQSANWEK
jgi:hypothetical protein